MRRRVRLSSLPDQRQHGRFQADSPLTNVRFGQPPLLTHARLLVDYVHRKNRRNEPAAVRSGALVGAWKQPDARSTEWWRIAKSRGMPERVYGFNRHQSQESIRPSVDCRRPESATPRPKKRLGQYRLETIDPTVGFFQLGRSRASCRKLTKRREWHARLGRCTAELERRIATICLMDSDLNARRRTTQPTIPQRANERERRCRASVSGGQAAFGQLCCLRGRCAGWLRREDCGLPTFPLADLFPTMSQWDAVARGHPNTVRMRALPRSQGLASTACSGSESDYEELSVEPS